MRRSGNFGKLGIVGLILLALVAAGLSVAALLQHRNVPSNPQPTETPSVRPVQTPTPSMTSPATTPTPSPTPTTPTNLRVVIMGDSHSVGDPAQTWVGPVAEQLNWEPVVNMAAPGRGYLATPRSCDGSPCTPFGGTVSAIADQNPDVVVTFGGAADGDFSITEAAAQYFQALRSALPDATLIAISTVTTEDQAPYWVTLHGQSVQAGVEAVGGVFVNVGQPGIGNGASLSAEAQAEIARLVIAQLS